MPAVGTFLANQGTVDQDVPEPQLLVSFDDADVSIPAWTDLTSRMRGYDSQRGRGSELSDFDAGSCTVVLDNRDRELDPTNAASSFYPNVRPMNRVWLRVHWAGAIHNVFTGWSEAAPQSYPGMVDALVTLRAVDEFKPLALDELPATDPPRDSYPDVVQSDEPVAYWRMHAAGEDRSQPAVVGPALMSVGTHTLTSLAQDGPIVGDNPDPYLATGIGSGTMYQTDQLAVNDPPDLSGATAFTIETWFRTDDATPAVATLIAQGPETDTPNKQWSLGLNTTGTVAFLGRKSSSTSITATSTATLSDDTWYHLVGVCDGTNLILYIDGVSAATAAWGSAALKDLDTASVTGKTVQIYSSGAAINDFSYGDIAIYRTALSSGRVGAHYTAGRSRGFAREQSGHGRIIAILDAVSSQAPRSIRTAQRNMIGAYMRGQSPLEELRDVVHAEAVDGQLFVAADGTITFLDAEHRGFTPWSTSQATFGDSGSELPYQDIEIDYSDSFIANQWNVTTQDGLTQTVSDATSIAAYYKRPQSITGLKITNGDAVALTVAQDMLAKYKDPMLRITGFAPQMANGPTATAALAAELGTKLRVKRRPPGGGAAIDQQSWVQQISVSGSPQEVYPRVRLGVSPV